ncbi:MAG: FHIPEP family type III secretion protein, partial [Candidatus Omnitrophica bacterium]|nr:FHIPEP family type III secretion protein [Candidatus Omnitrophota bacterium]
TLINIVGGLVVGMTQDGLGLGETLSTYTLLTIRDGLVSQIPALLISTAAGIVVTRAASKDSLGAGVSKQILAQPASLAVSAATLTLLGVLSLLNPETRGIFFPFAIMAGAMGGMWLMISRKEKVDYEHRLVARQEEIDKPAREAEPPESFLRVDPMELMIGYNLVPMMDSSRGGDFLDQVASIRRNIALEMGIVVPQIRIRDNMQLGANEYSIRIRGVQIAQGEVLPDHFLAINPGGEVGEISGVHTTEPAFGVPAVWVTGQNRGAAELAGYNVIDPSAVLATHLTEIVRGHSAELLDRQATQKLIEGVKEECPVVVGELLEGPQAIGIGKIQKVLQNLLAERVPVRNLPHILEILADNSAVTKEVDPLTEFVRVGLSLGIVQGVLSSDGTLSVIVL